MSSFIGEINTTIQIKDSQMIMTFACSKMINEWINQSIDQSMKLRMEIKNVSKKQQSA